MDPCDLLGLNAPRHGKHTWPLRTTMPRQLCTEHMVTHPVLKLLHVDILALVFGNMLLICQAAVKFTIKIYRIVTTTLELLSIPNDIKLHVGMPIFKMKRTNLSFQCIGSQVID